jgi:hypothetical protein
LCTWQKDWSFLLPILPRKVHFCMHDWRSALFRLCRFSFKWVQRWPSVPTARIVSCFSTNDCVHCKKTGHFCSQIRREKSIFESMIGARHFVGCVFPSNEYNNGHPCLRPHQHPPNPFTWYLVHCW